MADISRSDSLTAGPDRRPSPWAPPPVGAQRLTGRKDEIRALREHLDEGVLIVSDSGSAGVGRTALARRLAYDRIAAYPDGYIELDLGTGNVAPAKLHQRVLRTLAPDMALPEETRALRKLYLSTLTERRVLLILDGAASVVQLRALLPRDTAGAIVIAASDIADSYPQLYCVRLKGLTPRDAHQLLIQAAPSLAQLPRRQVSRLVDRVAGNPLALRLLAPLLADNERLTPRRLIRALDQAASRLFALRGEETPDILVDVALEIAYDHLAPELQRFFDALAIFPAPFTTDAAAAVWDVSVKEAQERLATLTALALIHRMADTPYFEIHDRVRVFAQELLLSQPTRSAALVARYVAHYFREAIQISTQLTATAPELLGRRLDHYLVWDHLPSAWHRLNGEDPGWPRLQGMDQWIRDFPRHCKVLLDATLSRSDYRAWLAQALEVAEGLDDPRGVGWLLGALGEVDADLQDWSAAAEEFERQIMVARKAEARDLEAEALMHAGAAHKALGAPERALAFWQRALVLLELMRDPRASTVRLWLAEGQGGAEGGGG